MLHIDLAAYHSKRARRERDLAFISSCPQAAKAHLALSTLHMQRLREVAPNDERRRPPFVLG